MPNFQVNLPQPPSGTNNIDHGRLTVQVNSGTPTTVNTTPGAASASGFSAELSDAITASFAWVNGAGTESANPATLIITLEDAEPPPDPDPISITITA